MSRESLFLKEHKKGCYIIQGWEAIGRRLGRSGRTARRWYDNYKMPVRYSFNGRPFVFTFELDSWMIRVGDLEKSPEELEKLREHAAYMRSCKKKDVAV